MRYFDSLGYLMQPRRRYMFSFRYFIAISKSLNGIDMIEYGVTSYKDTTKASLSLSFLSLHEINLVVYQNSPGESKEYTTASEW